MGIVKFKKSGSQKGFIALITVLIILGIILMTALSISFLSVEEANMSFQKRQSSRAYYLANLCAEEALMKLKETNGNPFVESKSVENGRCEISAVGPTVNIKADFQNQIRKIKIVVSQINPRMIINSWQEVAEF